jgi:hypothetical protein
MSIDGALYNADVDVFKKITFKILNEWLTLLSRWSKVNFKSPYVAHVIYENVVIVFIEIYRIR